MMWCNECGQAVEPQVRTEYDIPDVNVGGYREEHISVCPYCGMEVYQEPSCCAMCNCATSPMKNLCCGCIGDIQVAIKELAELKDVEEESVKDGIAEYLNMEDK